MFAARGSWSPRNQIQSAAPGFGGSESPSSRTCFRPGPGRGAGDLVTSTGWLSVYPIF